MKFLVSNLQKQFLLYFERISPPASYNLAASSEARWKSWLQISYVLGVLLFLVVLIRIILFGTITSVEVNATVLSLFYIFLFPLFALKLKSHESVAAVSILFALLALHTGVLKGGGVLSPSVIWYFFLPIFALASLRLRNAVAVIVVVMVSFAYILFLGDSDRFNIVASSKMARIALLVVGSIVSAFAGAVIGVRATELYHELVVRSQESQEIQQKKQKAEIENLRAATHVALHHEINNPAAVALGNLSLLKKEYPEVDFEPIENEIMQVVNNVRMLEEKMNYEDESER